MGFIFLLLIDSWIVPLNWYVTRLSRKSNKLWTLNGGWHIRILVAITPLIQNYKHCHSAVNYCCMNPRRSYHKLTKQNICVQIYKHMASLWLYNLITWHFISVSGSIYPRTRTQIIILLLLPHFHRKNENDNIRDLPDGIWWNW